MSEASKVIHVRNVGHEISESDLLQLVQPFGAVTKLVILRAKNQALLQMHDVASAATALQYYTNLQPNIRGRNVYMQFSSHQELTTLDQNSQGSKDQDAQPNRILLITIHHMLYPITVEVLHQVFSPHGFVEKSQMFDDMPQRNMHSWNILISSYAHSSLHGDALSVLLLLLASGSRPDHFTFPPLFKACAGMGQLCLGRSLHGWVVILGFEDHVVVGSSVLDMYAKCGSMNDAHHLFVKMRNKDVVTWNSMISGLARAEMSSEALSVFRTIQWGGMEVDPMVVPSVLGACGHAGDLRKGREVHGKLIRSLLSDSDTAVGNSLINMYAKCGCLDASHKVFSRMLNPNLVTWTTLISCCGLHGKGGESLALYEEMIARGFKPNPITFTTILSSCSHAGLVSQGQIIFESMSCVHGIEPGAEHYACMVDLLGRSGNLKEALALINKMPVEPTASVWGALLGACTVHKDVEIAEIAARRLFELEPGNPSNYIALCGIYDALDTREGVLNMRARMRELGLIKSPGQSWISGKGRVHSFYQDGAYHPVATKICNMLD